MNMETNRSKYVPGVEDDVPDPRRQSLHLPPDLLSTPVLRDAVHPESPVVHRLGDHQVAARPDLEVVQPLDRVLGILSTHFY